MGVEWLQHTVTDKCVTLQHHIHLCISCPWISLLSRLKKMQKHSAVPLLSSSSPLQHNAYVLLCRQHTRSLCPAAVTDGVHHVLLPSWRISEWGLRWTLRRAFPRHSYSHHCCFCWQSTPSISPRRFRSLWHISWLVSPPPCCPQPSRSSHPGGGDTEAGGKRRSRCWMEFTRTLASCSRR